MADEELTPKWYVAHTYSGYENKVKVDIENTIENRNLQDQIMEVCVPVFEDEEETESGRKKAVQRKLFPGYVLIHMFMNDDTWYVVRNTRGVTGFVGPGSKPVPLTEDEVRKLGMHAAPVECDFKEGDTIVVTKGVWEGTVASVKSINISKQKLTIGIDVFGRETPVELDFDEVRLSE